ncbi:MAG: U32 family peptidase, partial [Oscillospiraceae bacterium]
MNKIEILAPAGGKDALTAAVRCGANAVYLGSQVLNARRNATNFSFDELREAVSYCHARGVKVYITLNTIVSDDEFNTALSLIECG